VNHYTIIETVSVCYYAISDLTLKKLLDNNHLLKNAEAKILQQTKSCAINNVTKTQPKD